MKEKQPFKVQDVVGRDLLFVGGDLSGIQDFLYNITSKKAAVSLKGRSQYLVNLTNEMEEELLHLPKVAESATKHVIYSSGGKFYLIIDDTTDIRSDIDAFKTRMERKLWNEHKGQLAVNLAYVPFSFNGDETVNTQYGAGQRLGTLWKEANELFAQLKVQKFRSLLIEDYPDFFGVQDVKPDSRICAVSGVESSECVLLEKDSDGDEIYVLPSVKEQVELGKKLRDRDHFKTFEEYADNTYLGILRMDVDGLGKVFIEGFATLKAYEDFSNNLAEFFEEKLYDIQSKDKYKEYLNIVYAGGDDIFAVGRWDKLIDFANEVRKQFARHVLREGVSISGGIAIVDAKFPIAKAAILSGKAEEKAKKYNNGAKNAFNMFGTTVSWVKEFDFVEEWKNGFVELCEKEDMPTSILHKLMTFAYMKSEGNTSYVWNSVYFLARFKIGKSKLIRDFCTSLETKLFATPNNYELIALAARWAELTIRINK